MLELKITNFFNNGDHWYNSNSVANLGQNAGAITWEHAKQESIEFFFVTEETRQAIQEYVKGFGAWDWQEVTGWTDTELNALVLQFISADINELEAYTDDNGEPDWELIAEAQEVGQIASNLYIGDNSEYYYYIGY